MVSRLVLSIQNVSRPLCVIHAHFRPLLRNCSKLQERAQQKLKLDAMVVQQGRLKESDKLSKEDVMAVSCNVAMEYSVL